MTITRDQAIHEAGHAVVADALGLHVFCIEPHEDGPRCGIWAPEELSPIEHFAMTAYSLGGGAATLRDGGKPGDEACEDLDAAAEHAAAFAASGEDVDAALCRASWLAQSIVNDRWGAVLALAAHVEEHGGADEEAIDCAFAAYRSGQMRRKGGAVLPKEAP